jgi:hypothetical protein
MVMKEVRGRECYNPEADDDCADRKDPVAGVAILGGEGRGFTNAKNLASEANGHQKNAEDEGGPSHGLTFVP